MFKAILIAAVVPALAVMAQVDPSEPAPGNIYNEGSTCSISWAADTTGQWTTLNIELMTGSNTDMQHLTTVATIDGTKETSFSYTCPTVSPNSAIYFYQFSTPAAPTNLTWTGRFAIADASGNTVDPEEETDNIKWGTGKLTDSSSASAAPTYLNGGSVSTADSGASSASGSESATDASTTATATASASATISTTSVGGALTATGSLTTSVRSVSSASNAAAQASKSGSSSSSGTAAPSSSTTSAASALTLDFKTRGLQALAGLMGTAFVFATMF